jgi:cytochrome P450
MQKELNTDPAGHRSPASAGEAGLGEPVTLPMGRAASCPFDPHARLGELREQDPLVPMRYPDGHIGWLATGYATVRSVLADQRFSARHELIHYPLADVGQLPPAPVGDMTGLDAPEHTRFRKLLISKFTVRRMRQLTERVKEITGDCLDAMQAKGAPVDLVQAFAQPIPALMICELLGVPSTDRGRFQQWAKMMTSELTDQQAQEEAVIAFEAYMADLVRAKRAHRTDDLLGDITASDLTDQELAGVSVLLLAAGLETVANMLALGALVLLSHPDQLAALRAEPELAPQAVEELMRFLTIAHTTTKSALVDVELDGKVIKAGDSVTISTEAANRDPLRFPDPDTFDIRRKATGQLGFGHGVHQCLGQQLARVEMEVAFLALFNRFPSLRLAVPANEVPHRALPNIHGVHALPVTWDED